MGSLLTARNLPGIGDASPPEDEDLPECPTCDGLGYITEDHDFCSETLGCPHCNGTGYQPAPEYDPPMERED